MDVIKAAIREGYKDFSGWKGLEATQQKPGLVERLAEGRLELCLALSLDSFLLPLLMAQGLSYNVVVAGKGDNNKHMITVYAEKETCCTLQLIWAVSFESKRVLLDSLEQLAGLAVAKALGAMSSVHLAFASVTSLVTMPFGDHALCCGVGGERISRHNALRDAIYDTAVRAGLGPTKEGRFLLPGADRRPADVLLPHWDAGRDGALDVTVVHPFQDATVARAATEPGYPLNFAHDRKMRGAEADCRQQGISFIPLVAESMGGWHSSAEKEVKKLGSALARHTHLRASPLISWSTSPILW